MSPSGVAIAPILLTVLSRMRGIGSRSTDHAIPNTMPRMIGFVAIPFKVRFIIALLLSGSPGRYRDRTVTAITL